MYLLASWSFDIERKIEEQNRQQFWTQNSRKPQEEYKRVNDIVHIYGTVRMYGTIHGTIHDTVRIYEPISWY